MRATADHHGFFARPDGHGLAGLHVEKRALRQFNEAAVADGLLAATGVER